LREALKGAQEKYSKLSTEMIAVDVQFKTKSALKLLPDEACYLVTLEIGMPIDVVTLQSGVPAMLLDTTSNLAMVSRTPSDRDNGNALLATYRCQDNTNRLEIKIRAVEGEHGPLNAYIIPKQAPKTCQRASFQIKPLSLHEKVLPEVLEPMMKARVLNSLTLTGAFSLNEVHAWIGTCLPDVPPRITEEVGKLCFRSTFLQTVLVIDYMYAAYQFSGVVSGMAMSLLHCMV
jgi:Bardet-Biedl syndrome 7 protein